jgi:Glycosyltransferase family 87
MSTDGNGQAETMSAEGMAATARTAGAPSRERRVVAMTCLAMAGSCVGVALATVIARAIEMGPLLPGIAGTLVGVVVGRALGRRWLAPRLPDALDGWLARRRVLGIVWLATAALAVVNTARLGWFFADPSQGWASALPGLLSPDHQCLPAYVRAGELASRGQDNLWNPWDYESDKALEEKRAENAELVKSARAAKMQLRFDLFTLWTPTPWSEEVGLNNAGASSPLIDRWEKALRDDGEDKKPRTDVAGLLPHLSDPYEYPPTFAVLPRAALAITDQYEVLRAAWFGINAAAFWLVFLALAIWVGGRVGATSLLFAPVIGLSTPLLIGLQFGQAHLIVVAAAIGAMLQLARGRRITGGLLLGFATLTKIFPGILLVHLAIRRQWRDLAAALVAIAALLGLTALVVGAGTLSAFVSEQLPRMASGEAFAFTEDNPSNSLYSLAFKLHVLGIEGAGRELASQLSWAWTVIVVVLAALAARSRPERAHDAIVWLGVLCLATLRSPFAPTYSAIGSVWLLSLWAGWIDRRRWIAWAIVVGWIALQGYPPVGSDATKALLSLPSQIASIAFAVAAVTCDRSRGTARPSSRR